MARLRAALKSSPARRIEPERHLFELLCVAGELGYRLPDDDINLRHGSGAKDPRRRLAREFPRRLRASRSPVAWARAADRLTRRLTAELAARGDGESRPLRVLLSYASSALAPDCSVPREAFLRAAWGTSVDVFARLYPTAIRRLGRLPCVDGAALARLRREAAPGLRVGRTASGRRPGPTGRALAVDPSLMRLLGKALGRRIVPGYQAKLLYYLRPGDHVWPHPDDPSYTANCLLCIDHVIPKGQRRGSALLTYRPDGSVERHELEPGHALVMDSALVHAREPVREGEHILLLSILCR